jgi:hypothetical protein
VSYRGFNPLDIVGRRYGRLIVRSQNGKQREGRQLYLCECDCGTFRTVQRESLRKGQTKSCGCLRRDSLRKILTVHGGKGTPEYAIWQGMKARCNNHRAEKYPQYGGRGISVCSRWDSFVNFREDMGPRPLGTTIERINNDGDYTPENCRWATPVEQGRNKGNNRIITHDGRTMCMATWAEEVGISYAALRQRLYRGWAVARALEQPQRSWPRSDR